MDYESASALNREIQATLSLPPAIALGITRKGRADFVLAVRVQSRDLEDGR